MLSGLGRFFVIGMSYIANYGYTDGSGEYFVSIVTEKCNACGECIPACPMHIFQIEEDDYGDMVAVVKEAHRKSLKYVCAQCKPTSGVRDLPCQKACKPGAIVHSW